MTEYFFRGFSRNSYIIRLSESQFSLCCSSGSLFVVTLQPIQPLHFALQLLRLLFDLFGQEQILMRRLRFFLLFEFPLAHDLLEGLEVLVLRVLGFW